MQDTETSKPIPLSRTVAVLVGFPIIATLISLLLLNRSLITNLGLDFFNTFWTIIICWYVVQMYLISRILTSYGWAFKDIGFSFKKRKNLYLFGGYFIFAAGLLVFIEMALANADVDVEKLNEISSLTPKTTTARIIFIIMAFVGGLSEEIVYRGFAIKALINQKINKWLAIGIASIPFVFQHGLKSIEQFWWFLLWGLIFGIIYVVRKKLYINIIIHWLVILSAMIAILQVIE